MTRASRMVIPPVWTSVLAVMAHPDGESAGLGSILDAFVFAGARVEVLCLTHGQAWTLEGAPGDLAALRGAELATAADVLGPTRAMMSDKPDGTLGELSQTKLVNEVVAAADSCHPDGLLAFDAAAVSGYLDHATATTAAVTAGETLRLPVLGWTLSRTVADRRGQDGPGIRRRLSVSRDEQIDLRVTIDRARRRLASHTDGGKVMPGTDQWRRLELLAEEGGLRWLRPPDGVAGRPKAPACGLRRV